MGNLDSAMSVGTFIICFASLGLISHVDGSCLVSQPTLTWNQGKDILMALTSDATQRSIPVSICLKDAHDNVVTHVRMVGAVLASVDLSCEKAKSSARFPAPSSDLAAIPGLELSNGYMSNLRGGFPLVTSDGKWIGSVGVSGAPAGNIDEEIAKVAVETIASNQQICPERNI